ncbi:MAG: hypothetical protein LBR80_09240 [Deltaproteobacteria bacterium]|nr:hypothetical protein [Deltaproteobacteria bacterium]
MRSFPALLPALLSACLMTSVALLSASLTAPAALMAAPADALATGTKDGAPPPPDPVFGKAIVIVFSQTGKTMRIAELIAAKTGADIYKIEPTVPFPPHEGEIIGLEETRRAEGIPAEIKGPKPDLTPYSFVFLGAPVWFGGIPDHVALFLKDIDFGGRRMAIFASAGSQPGDIVKKLATASKGGAVIAPGLVNKREDDWGDAAMETLVEEYLVALKKSLNDPPAAGAR